MFGESRADVGEAVLDREQRGAGARFDADLAVEALQVIVDRLGRDAEQTRDLLHRQSACHNAQHLDLAFGQPLDQGASRSHAMACCRKHRGHRVTIQAPGMYLALEDSKRRLQRRMTKLLPSFGSAWPDKLLLK